MTLHSCSKCQQIQKKLKIVISDYEFEIKKIQQDKSTEKAMYEIHLQKQVRRWQQMYQKQKSLREDELKNWMDKYDGTVAKYQNQAKKLTQQYERQLKKTIQNLTNQSNQKISKLTTSYQTKIQNIEQRNKKYVQNMKAQHETKIKQILNQNQNTVNTLKKSHKNQLQQKIRVYESRVLGAQSQRIKQLKLHEQTRNQSKDIQGKLYEQIFYLRKNVAQLQGKLEQQAKVVKLKQDNISQLYQSIEKLKNQHIQQIDLLKNQNQKKIQQITEMHKNKLSQLYQESLSNCCKYQNIIQKMQEKRESEKAIYLNNIQQINTFVQNRASRPQDIQQIQYLREVLTKKTKQCECLSEELRFFRLQLQNKQETYNRIFVPMANPSNENIIYKRKEFKLRRQGRSVTTVRQALQSIQSANVQKKTGTMAFPPKPKVL